MFLFSGIRIDNSCFEREYNMIIYKSSKKINNLIKEIEINSTLKDEIKAKEIKLDNIVCKYINLTTSISMESTHKKKKSSKKLRYVLNMLKKKGKLKELTEKSKIINLSYISVNGLLMYVNCENEYEAFDILCELRRSDIKHNYRKIFHENDILNFRIIIDHENFDQILIKCTAKNIKVFSKRKIKGKTYFLSSESSINPGIIPGLIPVKSVIWVTGVDSDSRTIIGSPIIIFC